MLDGVRVVEWADGLAAAYCGRMLADAGASVTVAEPAGGHPLAARRPTPASPPGLWWAYLAEGKARVARSEAGDHLAGADIIIEDLAPALPERPERRGPSGGLPVPVRAQRSVAGPAGHRVHPAGPVGVDGQARPARTTARGGRRQHHRLGRRAVRGGGRGQLLVGRLRWPPGRVPARVRGADDAGLRVHRGPAAPDPTGPPAQDAHPLRRAQRRRVRGLFHHHLGAVPRLPAHDRAARPGRRRVASRRLRPPGPRRRAARRHPGVDDVALDGRDRGAGDGVAGAGDPDRQRRQPAPARPDRRAGRLSPGPRRFAPPTAVLDRGSGGTGGGAGNGARPPGTGRQRHPALSHGRSAGGGLQRFLGGSGDDPAAGVPRRGRDQG